MAAFERNLSTLDRILRFLSGLGMMYVAYFHQQALNSIVLSVVLGLIGLSFVIFAIISYCPVYSLAGFSTCSKK